MMFILIRFAHLFCFTQKAQKSQKFYSLRSLLHSLRSFFCVTQIAQISQIFASLRSAGKLVVPLRGASLELEDDFVYDVEVAHQVEAGVRVVQALVGARGVEDVERTLAAHIEPFGQERHDAPYLVPHQKVTQQNSEKLKVKS